MTDDYKSEEIQLPVEVDPTCTVSMDDTVYTTNDFVAILTKENGDASIFYNTDALTLGMAIKMISRAFVECMQDCPAEERKQVIDILGDAFVGFSEDVQDE